MTALCFYLHFTQRLHTAVVKTNIRPFTFVAVDGGRDWSVAFVGRSRSSRGDVVAFPAMVQNSSYATNAGTSE